MTKDVVSKIIYKHYVALGRAVKLTKTKESALILTKEELKELHAITILAYFYLTGEELPEIMEDKHDRNN